ncbi:hypothetical protein M493_01655 [Geobacillus genomosp. 3]|uniref:Uncharacterized protein n=1 Tax=Geobacillus genomosp. 3 TaxID=1921421 RepID=S5Z8Z4_GEOG3|nr:hypothetical protein M493_01655 [Geobacillus genomosp. 3]
MIGFISVDTEGVETLALRFVQFSRNKLIPSLQKFTLIKSDSYNISFLFSYVNMFFVFLPH